MRLKDKVALISGSGSGIGEATAKRLAAEGAAVVVVDLNGEGATRVAGEIRSAGGKAESLVANVGNPADVEKMIKFATDKFGQLDILHNNAIRLYTGRVGEMTLDHFRKAVEVGLRQRRDHQHGLGLGTGWRLRPRLLQRNQGGRDKPDARDCDRIRAQRYPIQRRMPRNHPDAADSEIARALSRHG